MQSIDADETVAFWYSEFCADKESSKYWTVRFVGTKFLWVFQHTTNIPAAKESLMRAASQWHLAQPSGYFVYVSVGFLDVTLAWSEVSEDLFPLPPTVSCPNQGSD